MTDAIVEVQLKPAPDSLRLQWGLTVQNGTWRWQHPALEVRLYLDPFPDMGRPELLDMALPDTQKTKTLGVTVPLLDFLQTGVEDSQTGFRPGTVFSDATGRCYPLHLDLGREPLPVGAIIAYATVRWAIDSADWLDKSFVARVLFGYTERGKFVEVQRFEDYRHDPAQPEAQPTLPDAPIVLVVPPEPFPEVPLILSDEQKRRGASKSKLFISYKRGTDGIQRLMTDLRARNYSVWFDRNDILLGDTNWQAKIYAGIWESAGVILCLTPKALESRPVQHEVAMAKALGKPIFPIVLEPLANWGDALIQIGLDPKQHLEDFTQMDAWETNVAKLLAALEDKKITPSRHEKRFQRDRNNAAYVLHQQYLTRLLERIGTLNLARIHESQAAALELEKVYVDSPTAYTLNVEVNTWQITDWWLTRADEKRQSNEEDETFEEREPTRYTPADLQLEQAALELLVERVQTRIDEYHAENPELKPDENYLWDNNWNNGTHKNVLALQLQHFAAARDRLVILGAPGSGKSTFVKHLALALAGEVLANPARPVNLMELDSWTHGTLTPVYVELRRFVASAQYPANGTLPTADHLWAYIEHELLGADLKAYATDLKLDLTEGHAVLILDGLDEVPYTEGKLAQRQQELVHLAKSLNTTFARSRIIVASRPYAYDGWTLPGFTDITITAFEDQHRIALAARLYQAAQLPADDAKKKAKALNQQLRGVKPELKDRPLFVTMMAIIFERNQQKQLPSRPGALYRQIIFLLLDRWTQSKPNVPSLTEILGDKTLAELYVRLAALAYDVHTTLGEKPGTPEISYDLLHKHLRPLGKHVAVDLITYLSENAGVLVCPGQNKERDIFHFAHRTLQEYLAAAHIVRLCIHPDDDRKTEDFTLVGDLITAKPQLWRDPCVMVGDVLTDTERQSDVWKLNASLLETDMPGTDDSGTTIWWRAWLAAQVAIEQELHQQQTLNRLVELPVKKALIEWLVHLIETPQALPPIDRAACGRALSLLGDPRPGVGCIEVPLPSGEGFRVRAEGSGVRAAGVAIPDIVWCDVPMPPGGKVWLGADDQSNNPRREVAIPYSYQIAKYPVTYRQFQAFIDDPEGFYDPRWWDGLADDKYRRHNQSAPDDQYFKYWNHPRENVSWYQAMAFCRWFSWRLGGGYDLDKIETWAVRLPTEWEWEYAARGTDERPYPYLGAFDATKSNTNETGIGQTSAVGLFPDGAAPAPCGALDMSGNVREWCLSAYNESKDNPAEEDISTNVLRVVRSGSWVVNGTDYFRADFRYWYYSFIGNNNWGFRFARSYK